MTTVNTDNQDQWHSGECWDPSGLVLYRLDSADSISEFDLRRSWYIGWCHVSQLHSSSLSSSLFSFHFRRATDTVSSVSTPSETSTNLLIFVENEQNSRDQETTSSILLSDTWQTNVSRTKIITTCQSS